MNIPFADTTSIPGIVIPEAFKQPAWVEETFKKFTDLIHEDYKKSNNKINHEFFRKMFVGVILQNKLTPTWPLNKKNVTKLINDLYELCDNEEFQWFYYLIYRAGFYISTKVSSSFTPESLSLPDKFRPHRQKIIEEYKQKLSEAKNDSEKEKVYIWVNAEFASLANEVLQYFRNNIDKYPVVELIDSGAKGSQSDLQRLLVAVGLSIDSKTEINDVIDKAHSDGLSQTQFFNFSIILRKLL